ncbi:MAG: GNAT family N-acetyltransferase [Rhodobacter sp.]|nr:GNAT family N-acetyltransferase [Rhodobacter sp.]
MKIGGYEIAPLTPDRWADFETVLGRGGISGCWCMYWLTATGREFEEGRRGGSTGANKAAFQKIVRGGAPGLLAYDGATPVAWVRVMPRMDHPGLRRSRLYGTAEDIAGIWSLSCFVIRRDWRGRGLSGVLIRAAIAHARDNGALTLEAYPNDTVEPSSPMALYRGRASTFRRLGFVEVRRKAPQKPMMRFRL